MEKTNLLSGQFVPMDQPGSLWTHEDCLEIILVNIRFFTKSCLMPYLVQKLNHSPLRRAGSLIAFLQYILIDEVSITITEHLRSLPATLQV